MSFTRNLAVGAIGIGALLTTVNQFMYNVDGGERAVIFDRLRGIRPNVYGEGTHLKIPFIQSPVIYDIKYKPHVLTSIMSTRDIQNVNITLRVLCRPEDTKLPEIYRSLGVDYDYRVLPSIGNEILKSVVAHYNAEHLVTKRDSVSKEIRDSLTKRAQEYGIEVADVSITHLSFTDEFIHTVEQKQVAQQIAERAKFIVLKSEQEKLASIIRAEGESESAKLINKALVESGPGLVEIRRIETANEIAKTLSQGSNVTYLPGNSNVTGSGNTNLLLNISK